MEEILSKINSELLTEAVIADLKTEFENLVESKVEAESEKMLETYDAKFEEFKKTELVKESERILDTYDVKLEEFQTTIEESKEKELAEYKSELLESLDTYLDLVVNEYLTENKLTIDTEVEVEKANAVLEAFDALLVTTGVEVSRIVEAKEEAEVSVSEEAENTISDMETRLNKALDENKELVATNTEMLKLGLTNEVCEGLSDIQKDKFDKLSALVEMGEDKEDYLSKLEAIRESVISTKIEVVQEPKKEVVIEESKKEEQKIESSRFF
jgi:hypothetical protein